LRGLAARTLLCEDRRVTDHPTDEPPHDILAAEEFTVPAGDPTLRHVPVAVPEAPFSEGDPVHDVLAAEEFAMPAGPPGASPPNVGGARGGRRVALGGVLAAIVAVLLRRRR
jgi:hypothetical protein